VGKVGVECSDGNGVGSVGDDCQEVLGEEPTMQGVEAVFDEIFCG
jgi:hypothetical protein